MSGKSVSYSNRNQTCNIYLGVQLYKQVGVQVCCDTPCMIPTQWAHGRRRSQDTAELRPEPLSLSAHSWFRGCYTRGRREHLNILATQCYSVFTFLQKKQRNPCRKQYSYTIKAIWRHVNAEILSILQFLSLELFPLQFLFLPSCFWEGYCLYVPWKAFQQTLEH